MRKGIKSGIANLMIPIKRVPTIFQRYGFTNAMYLLIIPIKFPPKNEKPVPNGRDAICRAKK
jgi:hypothetical protein